MMKPPGIEQTRQREFSLLHADDGSRTHSWIDDLGSQRQHRAICGVSRRRLLASKWAGKGHWGTPSRRRLVHISEGAAVLEVLGGNGF